MSQLANNLEAEIERLKSANEKMRADCRDAGNAMAEMEDEFRRLLSPTHGELMLMAGDMTPQELRAVRDVLHGLKSKL